MADNAKWAKFLDADGDTLYVRPDQVVAVKKGKAGRTDASGPPVAATSKMFAAGNWAIEVIGDPAAVLAVLDGEAKDTYPPLVKGKKEEPKAVAV